MEYLTDPEFPSEKWYRRKLAERAEWRGFYFYDPSKVADEVGAVYDVEAVERVFNFFGQYLVHVEGEMTDEPFILAEWQMIEIICPLFGYKKNGLRIFRDCFVQIGRKAGKSAFCAGIGLYLLSADREGGSKVITAATSKDQAKLISSAATAMAQRSPRLREVMQFYKIGSITIENKNASFHALSSIPMHGLNPHGLTIDELHQHKNEELIAALTTAQGARRQPIIFKITTAGDNKDSICYREVEYAKAVISGKIRDTTYLPVIFSADEDAVNNPDCWHDRELWKKVHPGIGISTDMEYLEKLYNRALISKADEVFFKRLMLNIWTGDSVRWLSNDKWAKCKRDQAIDQFIGDECIMAFDASATTDFTALSCIFKTSEFAPSGLMEDHFHVFVWHWLPDGKMKERKVRDAINYDRLLEAGHLELTEGDAVDLKSIKKKIDEIRAMGIIIKEIGFDKWNAQSLVNDLADDGYQMVQIGQNFGAMSGPSKAFETLIQKGLIHHDGNELLSWQIGMVEIMVDSNGNIKPTKKIGKKGGQIAKIDGVVATIMALSRSFVPDPGDGVGFMS